MKLKSIDINQRIPLDVLHIALESYLKDEYDEEYILQQLRLSFKGENRLKKSMRIVNKIVQHNPIIDVVYEHKLEVHQALKIGAERNIILVALLCSAFTFAYDSIQIIGKYLSVQQQIKSELIRRSLGNIYGGNRSMQNALYSVVPMFIEAGFIKRPVQGLYELGENNKCQLSVTKQLYIASYNVHFEHIDENLAWQTNPYFLFLRG